MNSLFQLRPLGRLAGVSLLVGVMVVACGEDGQDGATPVLEQIDADDECEHGGVVLRSGVDTSGDGEIDGEAEETVFCHGADGADGDSGTDGDRSLMRTSAIEPGDECPLGGIKIESGIDVAGDGELGDDEVQDTNYVCRDRCSSGELLEIDIATDELPERFAKGYTYDVSVTSDADSLDLQVLNPGAGNVTIDANYDHGEETLFFEHIEGQGLTEVVVIATDGCDFTAKTIQLGPYEKGLVDVYFGHLTADTAAVNVVDSDDNESTYTTLDLFEFDGPHAIEWGDRHFELIDPDDDSVIATSPAIALEPFEANLIYVYDDDGDLEFGSELIDDTEPDDEHFQLRAFHLDDDNSTDDLGVYSIADDGTETPLLDTIAFGESTDVDEFSADSDAIFGFDTNGDGDIDATYVLTLGVMADGAALELFAVSTDDVTMLVAFDHTTETTVIADPRTQAYPSTPELEVDPGSGGSDVIDVDDCPTVDSIDMDVDISLVFATLYLKVTLEGPEGVERTLWDEGDREDKQPDGNDDFIGNLNENIFPSGGDSVSIDNFEGEDGTGDWTLRLETSDPGVYSDREATLHSWQLNLICTN